MAADPDGVVRSLIQGRIALRAVGGREFDQPEPMAQIGALLQEK